MDAFGVEAAGLIVTWIQGMEEGGSGAILGWWVLVPVTVMEGRGRAGLGLGRGLRNSAPPARGSPAEEGGPGCFACSPGVHSACVQAGGTAGTWLLFGGTPTLSTLKRDDSKTTSTCYSPGARNFVARVVGQPP